MIFLIFLLFLLSPKSANAVNPTVTITNFPETVIANEVFKITFNISNADVGTSYHIKVMNDLDNNNVLTQPITTCSSNYSYCENINIATDSANIATASAKMNLVSGIQNIKIRIAKDNSNGHTLSDSQLVSINSVLPTPTNTPIPTLTPTNTPTPTATKTPTPTPTKILSPTPTVDLNLYTASDQSTLTAVLDPIEESTPTSIPETPTLIPTPAQNLVLGNNTTKKNFLPLIFICLGGLFLLTPLVVSKIKLKQ